MLRQYRSPSSDGSGAKACRRPEAQSDDHAVSEGRGIGRRTNFIRTEAGTPQGGIISPLLANIALSVIEKDMSGG